MSGSDDTFVKGKYSKIDAYGFKRDSDFDYKSYENFISEYNAILARRAQRWQKKNGFSNKFVPRRTATEKRFIRKGIPMKFRKQVWMETSGAAKRMEKNKNVYQNLLKSIGPEDSEMIAAIDTDLDRTYPNNVNFENNSEKKRQLRNVLCAIGKHIPNVGYCQGLNYIAGLLLLVVGDEESSFWLLESLLSKILPQYYTEHLFEMRVDMEVFTRLIRKRMPAVVHAMEKEGINFTLVSSKWFICVFADVLPTETAVRVWDCLFMEGSKVIFRVAIFLVQILHDEICNARDVMELTQVFKNVMTGHEVIECHSFMELLFKKTKFLKRSTINQLRSEVTEELKKQEK